MLSRDLMFFTAVEGIAGAMGHRARQAETLDAVGQPDLLIADFASASIDAGALASAFDPMRTVVFAPHTLIDAFTSARAHGLAGVFRRGALAAELPRLLTEYSAGT
ncbi:MAG: hypothetical protein HUU14_00140 [Dehalococcoidia bacterium]|nr:hypothetical protein [Dehalococcoidia bacterium]NUQ54276.1 hypothetical protein [Dehalococcoidia bacterium]